MNNGLNNFIPIRNLVFLKNNILTPKQITA